MDPLSASHYPRRSRLLALLIAFTASATGLACLGETDAVGKTRVFAKVHANSPATVRVAVRTSHAARRILFFVDGRRSGIRRSVRWHYGRKGVLRMPGALPGRHRLTVTAIHPRGRVSKASRSIHLRRGARLGVGPAQQLTKPNPRSIEDEPKSTASSLPPGVLFDGGFNDGFDSWYVQSLDSRATLIDGGASHESAARFEVRDGDVEPDTGSERSEVSGPTFKEGQDLYFRDLIRVPSANSYSAPWQIIHQLHEHDWGGPPGIAVFLDNERDLKLGAGDSSPIFWHSAQPLEHDRWYALVYRVKLSRDPGIGFVEVWLDGVPQRLENGETRIYGQTIQTSSTYLKAGIYRSKSSTGTSIIEHDDIVVGTSYDAVMG